MSNNLLVSVVIPAYNRLDLLEISLSAFEEQTAACPFEVIVVDDGSEPPVSIDGRGSRFKLIRQVNRGRSAAVNTGIDVARGHLVIICDSDIVPTQRFIDEHLEFHRSNPCLRASHTGGLVWGVDAGVFGDLVGARANPRMIGYAGPLKWGMWYTDNWSCKRDFLKRNSLRFDTAFRAWGFEDLEFAHRLLVCGATNTASLLATGRHLKAVTLDGMIKNFARSVPNLVYLASKIATRPEIRDWCSLRFRDPRLIVVAHEIVRISVSHIESQWVDSFLSEVARQKVRIDVSNAVFMLGIQYGFVNLKFDLTCPLAAADADLMLNYCELVASAVAVSEAGGKSYLTRLLYEYISVKLGPFGPLLEKFKSRVSHGVSLRV